MDIWRPDSLEQQEAVSRGQQEAAVPEQQEAVSRGQQEAAVPEQQEAVSRKQQRPAGRQPPQNRRCSNHGQTV